jgi:hypothetical protein
MFVCLRCSARPVFAESNIPGDQGHPKYPPTNVSARHSAHPEKRHSTDLEHNRSSYLVVSKFALLKPWNLITQCLLRRHVKIQSHWSTCIVIDRSSMSFRKLRYCNDKASSPLSNIRMLEDHFLRKIPRQKMRIVLRMPAR